MSSIPSLIVALNRNTAAIQAGQQAGSGGSGRSGIAGATARGVVGGELVANAAAATYRAAADLTTQIVSYNDLLVVNAVQASSRLDLLKSRAAATQAADSFAGGVGRAKRFIDEHAFGAETLQNQIQDVQTQAAFDERLQNIFQLGHTVIANKAGEAQTDIALIGQTKGQVGSVVAQKQAQQARTDALSSIALTERESALQAQRETAVVAYQLKTNQISPLIALQKRWDIAKGRNVQQWKEAEDTRHVQQAFQEQALAVSIQKRGEKAQFGSQVLGLEAKGTFAQHAGQAAEALEAGTGGEREAMRLQQEGAREALRKKQEAEMKLQKEAQTAGSSPAEVTAALGESQKKELAGQGQQQAHEKADQERQIQQSVKDETMKGNEAILQAEGQFYEARREAFNRSAADQMLAVRERSKEEIEAVRGRIIDERHLMEQQIAWHEANAERAVQLQVKMIGADAAQNALRALGATYQAEEAQFKASWDAKIQAARNAANEDKLQPEERARRQRVADALEASRSPAEAAHREERDKQLRDIKERAGEAEVKNRYLGAGQTAAMMARQHELQEKLKADAGNPERMRQDLLQAKSETELQQKLMNRPGVGRAIYASQTDLSNRYGDPTTKSAAADLLAATLAGNVIMDKIHTDLANVGVAQ